MKRLIILYLIYEDPVASALMLLYDIGNVFNSFEKHTLESSSSSYLAYLSL